MTAEIVHLNANVTRQKTLLESFQVAADILGQFDAASMMRLEGYRRFDSIEVLAKNLANSVTCDDSLKETFEGAACLMIIKTMIPNFEWVDLDDREAVSGVVESSQLDLIRRFQNMAVRQGLLPPMFENRYMY